MPPLRVLLPPSESKTPGGDGPPFDYSSGTFSILGPARRKVGQSLRRRDFDPGELGVGGATLAAARADNRAVLGAPTLPALERYSGVLYTALGYGALPRHEQAELADSILVVSGLLGVVAGGDPTPAYKAPMGARVPVVGRLAGFWKPVLARRVPPLLAGHVVWDLLPGVHAAALPPLGAQCWKVRVLRERAGKRTTISHENKTIKGHLARDLVRHAITDPAALDGWEGPGGYRVVGVRDRVVDVVTRD